MKRNTLRRSLGGALGALALIAASAAPASAIRFGEPDNGEHPYVGLMVAFENGSPAWRCSGTLISETVFLTAGHCTFGADHVEIWFDGHVKRVAEGGNYPLGPGDASGTPHTHPLFNDATFWMHDAGVVVLDEPYTGTNGEFGKLPAKDAWDKYLAPGGKKNLVAEPVGYGLQWARPDNNPKPDVAKLDRMKAAARIIGDSYGGNTGKGIFIVFSGNANTGGTCFGDSGGPIFMGTNSHVVGAVTSYGKNAVCAGQGGGYRIDQTDDLEFIGSFL